MRICFLVVCATLFGCGGGSSTPRSPDADRDSVADAQDCAPSNPAAWQFLEFQSQDADSDSHFVNTAGSFCAGATLPARYSATAVAGAADCDDGDNKRWQLLAHEAVDADLDGHGIASAGQVCSGASLPAGYLLAAPTTAEKDCDDAAPSAWRFMTTYADADGDGFGAGGGTVACLGGSPVPGSSLYGYDPADDDLPSWQLTTP
jgi:hypothetical protein